MIRPTLDTTFARMFVAFTVISIASFLIAAVLIVLLIDPRNAADPPGASERGAYIMVAMLMLGILVSAWVGARLLSKPMSRLAEGAARLGTDLRSPPLAERGPAEARQAARIFNQMREQILRQVEERSRFLAAVSHDLRAPLTRLRLRVNRADEPLLRDKVLRDVDEMTALVNETLDYLRGIDRGEPIRMTDLVALVEALVDDLKEEGADIAAEGHAQLLAVRAGALRRCLQNLASNAIRYAGQCRLRLIDADTVVRIEVEDRGPGIPESQLAAVLQPFWRVEQSRNREHGGIGLGLAIADDIAKSHGGSLVLRNRPEGGLVATVSLPRAPVR